MFLTTKKVVSALIDQRIEQQRWIMDLNTKDGYPELVRVGEAIVKELQALKSILLTGRLRA